MCTFTFSRTNQAPIVRQSVLLDKCLSDPDFRNVDNVIHWKNLYPVDSAVRYVNTCPLDSNLSVG